MTRYGIRCTVCNKFITMLDMADDGMCEHCADKLEQLVRKRTKLQTFVVYMLVVLVLALALGFLAILGPSNAGAANQTTFTEEYFVTGVNLTSNERVVGWLSGVLGEPQVSGHVLDRGHYYVVVGHINGKGQFILESLCCEYDVVVTDEVTSDKLENRQQWEN